MLDLKLFVKAPHTVAASIQATFQITKPVFKK